MFIPESIKTRMIRTYDAAAANGDAEAMFFLSTCYGSGFGVDADKEKMIAWAVKAAELGNLDAVKAIAGNYDIVDDLPGNRTLLFPHFLEAAKAGHRDSMLQIGRCYYYGIGVERKLANGIVNTGKLHPQTRYVWNRVCIVRRARAI